MAFDSFVISDYYELIALQRVFREAKFCTVASDEDISASPIVAALFERVLNVLVAMDVERKGSVAAEDWANWRKLDPTREEWEVARSRALNEPKWRAWSDLERLHYVETLLSPFVISENLKREFISSIESPRSL